MSKAGGKVKKVSTQARGKARRLALQALYQWDLSNTDLCDIEKQFRESEEYPGVDEEYFLELLHKIPAKLDIVEAGLVTSMEIPWEKLDPVERALLRLASYELQCRFDIPYRVVINEAVNLAKKFGAEDAHKFINGVLDKAAKTLRTVEHPEGTGDSPWPKKS